MQLNMNARLLGVQLVCVGSASLSAAYYASWAPSLLATVALGAFAFALDLVKPQMFTAAAEAVRDRRFGAALVSGCLACLLAVVSMIAVDGMLLKLRTDSSGTKTHVQGAWDRADAAYKGAVADLAAIGSVEPKAKLEAMLESSVPVDVWRRTRKCTDITQAASRTACEPALRIKEQIARSERHAALEQARDAAKRVLDTTERPAAADPQVEVMSRAFKRYADEATILLALTWLAGLAVELVSCFGPALLRSGRKEDEAQLEAPSNLTPEQQALQWVLGEMSRSGGKLVVLNAAIAAKFGVDPATATRWRQRWVEAGLISEMKDGRQIVLKLARR